MSDFDVDVVIPAHQAERTVAAAVSSALGQILKPRSVTVVADSCSDATVRVAREAGAEVVLAEAGTPGAARNVGVRQGQSGFIAFLDADDRWYPTWLEAVAGARQAAPTSAVFYGIVEQCSPSGARLARTEREVPAGRLRDTLLTSSLLTTSAVVVRRDAFMAARGFTETLYEIEDLDLWLRLAEIHVFTLVRGRHVTYVRTPGSAMRDPAHVDRICEQHLRVIENALDRGLVAGQLRRRALALVHRASASRLLATGAARPALREAALSFRRWPFDPSVWALAALALQPAPMRGIFLTARRRWWQRWSRHGQSMGSPT